MRMLLKARLDTEKGSELIESGRMGELLESLLQRLQPEAAYFTPDRGHRSCLMVFDMQDSSQLVALSEPFFNEMGAEVTVQPAMNLDDVKRGLASLKG
ncbi:hypothetical protein ACH4RA_27320 [Streptomyces smyrnaeus]|uniref:hypothetical protein n=1 Tax=Streptomyces TaxID=1883 RepID=UPI000C1A784D|nr:MULTISPECIES: hypothetical protein [unclassified Streptomyces]MBQ0864132.1 hypothetical protein [Streptomyces sp. RK75]MBQ1120022.1 hypothetical protein [Streptomyces sp. B15]MBQ1160307.1 hypothetical protein [Streptomyces sp. A73]